MSKEELHAAVWGGAVVSDDSLTSTVAELRRALRESARRPRVIETVHRRGLRFIARLQPPRGTPAPETPPAAPATPLNPSSVAVVGRDGELELLRESFRRAAAGQRQVVFVAGEAGIGKSTVVEAFVREVRAAAAPVLLGHGQCVEQYGQREAYMAALEAIERMSHTPGGKDRLLSALRTSAPSWLAQMPSLEGVGNAARSARWREDTTPQRMLREFASLIETLASDVPLLLILEDLHWSDQGTMDLVSVFAQRREPARAMLLATYRPAQATVMEHPIQHVLTTLHARRQCTEIGLGYLTRADVAAYLDLRFPGTHVEPDVAAVVHSQTDGNPLYMVLLVDHLLARGWLAQFDEAWRRTTARSVIARDVPDSLRHMIEEQLRFVSPAERDALEVASICGVAFDAPMVASGLGRSDGEAELVCHGLARGKRWLRYLGSRQWPDGVVAARYAFQHALYQLALYDRLPPSRRATLHERIGRRLEAGFTDRTAEVSSELARHFEGTHDARRALVYLEQAVKRAHDRLAYGDMVVCLESALRLISEMPDTPDPLQGQRAGDAACSSSL